LYPDGHFGATPVTIFFNLPLTHVSEVFFATGLIVTAGFGLSACVFTKVLGVAVILTGTISL
jgi:hypothetical protein